MKRWMSLLVVLLLLTGCTGGQNTEPEQTAPDGKEKPVTAVELPEGEYTRLAVMGSDLLLMGRDSLTLLSGDTLEVKAAASLMGLSELSENDLQVGSQSIAWYNRREHTLHFLDKTLQEYGHITMEENVLGAVRLTGDWTTLYYCTAGGIQVRDLNTGISRTLTHKEGGWLGITGSFLDDTVLQCQLEQADGSVTTMMISAKTGQTLRTSADVDTWNSHGELYFCSLLTEEGLEWIYGWGDGQPRNFRPGEQLQVMPLLRGGKVVTFDGAKLSCYDLETGSRIAANTPKETPDVDTLTWFDNYIFFLSQGRLYRWDPRLSPVEDDSIYMSLRYTLEDPDEEGMKKQTVAASMLGKKYGVNIILWNDAVAVQPEDYTFSVEYVPENYEAGLTALDQALSRFDREFLRAAAQWTSSGTLNIVLVRGIDGASAAYHSPRDGMQYLLDGNSYIVLTLDGKMEQTLYHSLGHILDITVMSHSDVLYDWNDLNPKDFQYDNDYAANLDRDGSKYLQAGKESFIDTFSMSYPVEDRATILAYAIQPGNESRFASRHMQAKLEKLCEGIRDAFGLTGEYYIWEQYIHE